ncbi:MAG: ATP-binding protein [Acidobacteriota bacterium]
MRFFNTEGPVNPSDHYCLPPLQRLDLDELMILIERKKYFVLHAPRQTGKTSALLALMKHLEADGRYRCAYANFEVGQSAREDVGAAINAILAELASRAKRILQDGFVDEIRSQVLARSGPHAAFGEVLAQWSENSSRPLVLLIDEIDALVGDTLIAVLRQLRAGYTWRPAQFPQSVILCGVRDVRDYRIHSSSQKEVITGGSAFNIKAESLRLGDFDRREVEALYRQHTEETGQAFADEALEEAWRLTQGQPWLTNALAYQCCFRDKAGRDRGRPVSAEMVDQAKEDLILRRDTHLHQLADKLEEERVRRVIAPLLSGREIQEEIPPDDLEYVRDLGLIRPTHPIEIANPIYREIIPRQLTYTIEARIVQDPARYVRQDGSLDLEKLLLAFRDFFRMHSEHWGQMFGYREAGPQLLMQAFLHRIVNSGGRVEREYGLGRGRTDLLAIWPHPGGEQRAVIELKILRGDLERTIQDGLEQTLEYMDRCGAEEGHLVIFDRGGGKSWEERLFRRREEQRGRTILVWGM